METTNTTPAKPWHEVAAERIIPSYARSRGDIRIQHGGACLVYPGMAEGIVQLRDDIERANSSEAKEMIECLPIEVARFDSLLRFHGLRYTVKDQEFRFRVELSHRLLDLSKYVPFSLGELEGRWLENPLKLCSNMGWCNDGVADFCDKFGIGYVRESGWHECSSCGSEVEGDDCGDIEDIDAFEITPEMVKFWERNYDLDKIKSHLDINSAETVSDIEWSSYKTNGVSLPMRAKCIPMVHRATVPEWVEDSQTDDYLAGLTEVTQRFLESDLLPPVPCRIVLDGRVYEWNPDEVELTWADADWSYVEGSNYVKLSENDYSVRLSVREGKPFGDFAATPSQCAVLILQQGEIQV